MAARSLYLLASLAIILLTAQSTLAAADTELTCYTNVQPGTPGDVTVTLARRGDGLTVCFTAELKQPTQTGSWIYGVTDNATCDAVLQTDESRIESTFQKMTCCATPKCNVPDRGVDLTTAVNGAVMSQRSVLCAMALVLAAVFVVV